MALTPQQAFAEKHGQRLSELESIDLGCIDPRSSAARAVLEQFIADANGGSLLSMCTCAAFFRTGWGAEPNGSAAVAWARKAAETGYPPGQVELALCFENAVGTARDVEAAVRLLEQAVGGGYATAALHLALLYHLGRVVPADPDKAMRYVLTAIDLGDVLASFVLATWYEDGDGVGRDTVQARRWYEHAARSGSVFASTRLAFAYSKGELDLPQDQKRAREFARMAEQAELP